MEDDLLVPKSSRIDHRIVSAALIPVSCDIDHDLSAKSSFRNRSYSPRPASLNSIVRSTRIKNNSLPMFKVVSGDDRAALLNMKKSIDLGDDVYRYEDDLDPARKQSLLASVYYSDDPDYVTDRYGRAEVREPEFTYELVSAAAPRYY